MKNKMIKLILTVCILVVCSNSFALKGDSDKPMQIDADNATVDNKNKVSTFNGNVIITRGSLVVHSNKAIATENSFGDKTVTLYGTPVSFVQLEDDGEKIEGQGNQFVYNTKTNLGVLSGRARVKKGKNIVIGDTITYNSKTQVYSATSTRENGIDKNKSGRVTVILQAESK
jgi:lipopolysaccharide export system protein LptA